LNTNAFPYGGIAPGRMSLHPGPDNHSPTILRFTAPSATTYNFSVKFLAGDIGDMISTCSSGQPVPRAFQAAQDSA
jgi:hypothetical protein